MFVINWKWRPNAKAYVTKRQPNYKPFTSDPHDPDCKTWKTRKGAEYWLSLKDKSWASDCIIEEIKEKLMDKKGLYVYNHSINGVPATVEMVNTINHSVDYSEQAKILLVLMHYYIPTGTIEALKNLLGIDSISLPAERANFELSHPLTK